MSVENNSEILQKEGKRAVERGIIHFNFDVMQNKMHFSTWENQAGFVKCVKETLTEATFARWLNVLW